MAETSSGTSGLTARLQQQAAQERQQIEAVIQTELATLSANSKAIVQRELSTIERDIQRGSHRLRAAALSAWMRPVVIGLLILLGICGGSWGLLQWQSSRVQRLLETQEALRLAIAQEQQTLDQLQAQTWGVWLHEAEDGTRHVVLPVGTFSRDVEWPWTVRGQPAVPLSSE